MGNCKNCGLVKLFYRKARNQYICSKKRMEDNKPYKAKAQKRYRLKGYGLTEEEIAEVNEIKDCQVCGDKGNLNVDHCHETIKYRGVLCRNCNVILGFARDNPDVKLADYLERW